MLPPDKYQALRERVDLEFAPENPTRFGADDPVALEVDVKNVRQLIIKVFEINTENYYKQHAQGGQHGHRARRARGQRRDHPHVRHAAAAAGAAAVRVPASSSSPVSM